MPTRERVQALIDLVERGRYVEAIEAFYHVDASMQENLDPPRQGRETLIRGERRVIEAHRSIRTGPVRTFMVEGDCAVINWVFDFVDHEGRAFTLDELACQLWRGPALVTQSNMAAALGPILFVAVVVGGLGSLAGAFLASLLIGLVQTFAVSVNLSVADVLGPIGVAPPSGGVLFDVWNVTVAQIAPIIPYLLLVLILILRPTGLMGTREH